ncbi:MAG: redox-regulated ATPase YchF [Planctomycetes bacterium]|nr:redox-regulated ATPase YchF [Planctomycetota bacterium]
MKVGLVGYQGGGKSTVFELLTGVPPDPSKAYTGQVGVAVVPDERFDRLVELLRPRKVTPAKIELFDTPGLSREDSSVNAQRLAIIRECAALVQVIGTFAGWDPLEEAKRFEEDLILADLQVVSNRIERLKKDVVKARPDRDDLAAELEALQPLAETLEQGETLRDWQFTEQQDQAVRSFALLTRKKQLVLINTAESQFDSSVLAELQSHGLRAVAAPVGLELELLQLPEDERAEFAAEMGLTEPCRERLLRAIFEVTDQITFYTCTEKEARAWLLKRGATALDAAAAIHTDLARGFIRAEVMSADDLLRLGSEREVKAAGLHHVEGKDYVVQDGDEILIRFNV